MPNEFLVKNGLISQGNVTVTGSLTTSQGDIIVNYNSTSSNSVFRTFATNHAAGNRNASLAFGLYDGALTAMTVVNTASSNPSFNSQYISFATHEGGINVGERMRITPLGNVGIGTINPTATLQIVGSVLATSFTGSLSGSITNALTASYLTTANSYTITNLTASNISASGTSIFGNVGIGTTGPSYKLDVQRTSDGTIGYFRRIGATINPALGIYANESGNSVGLNTDYVGAVSPAIAFSIATVEQMRITNVGNVGIGTNNPAYKLDVSGSVFVSGIGTKFSGPTSEDGYRLKFYDNGGVTNDPGIGLDGGGLGSEILWFNALQGFYWYAGTSGEKMRLTSAGNLGIGTSSPGSKLQINDNTPVLTIRANDGGTSRKAYIDFYTTFFNYPSDVGARRTSTIVTGFDSGVWGTEFLSFNVGSGSANDAALLPIERVRIDGSGNLGVGTSTIIGKLQVNSTSAPYYGPATSSATANGIFILGNTTADVVNTFGVDASATAYAWIQPRKTGTATYYSLALNPNGGNVGIGTTAPAYLLDVSGSSRHGYRTADNHYFTGSVNISGSLNATASWANNALTASSLVAANSYTITNLTASNISASLTGSFGIVGIGTTAPAEKLDVRGGAIANGNGTIKTVLSYTTEGLVGTLSNHALLLYTNNTEKARITSDGNVGIGTTSPNSKLEVAGTAGTGVVSILNTTNGRSGSFGIDGSGVFIRNSSDGDYFDLKNASGVARFRVIYDNATHLTTNFVSIGNLSATGSKLSVFGNTSIGSTYGSTAAPTNGLIVEGKVGIGTTSLVTGFLDVRSNASKTATATNIVFFGSNDASNPLGLAINHESASGIKMVGLVGTEYGASGNNIKINETVTVQYNGSVGIGTTAPAAKLEMVGGEMAIKLGANTTSSFQWKNSSGTKIQEIRYDDSDGSMTLGGIGSYPIKFITSTTEKVRIAGDGNVGIGTTIPGAKFEVLTSAVGLANQPNIIGNFRGDTDGRSLIRVDNTSTSAGAAALQAGISFVAYSNVSSQPSANKHEAQIILGSTGATSVPGGQTGTLQIIAPQDIAFNVSASNIIMTGSSYTTFGYNAMYITRAGNIGIGTTNPSSRLHISGSSATAITITDDVLYTNSISNDNSVMTYTVDTGNAAAASAAHVFKRFNTELVRIDPSGNVGIGTTSPGALLELSSSTAANLFNIKGARGNNIIYVSGSGNIGINSSAFDPLAPEALLISGSTYNIISADTNINTYGQVHTQNRNAGTAASSDLVATNDTGNEVGNYVDMGINSSGYTAAFIGNANDGYLYNTGSQFYIGNASPGRNLYFFAGSTTNTASMMLSASGNVGIGTTNPTAKLQVIAGNSPAISILSNNSGQYAYQYIGRTASELELGVVGGANQFFTGTVAGDAVIKQNSTGKLHLGYGSAAPSITIDSSNNVGIGSTSPGFKFDVSGSGANARIGNAEIGQWPAATAYTYFGHEALDHSVGGNYAVVQSSAGETFINSAAGQVMHFSVGNSEKVQINSSGNVGINTQGSAITSKLVISGSGTDSLLLIKSPISGAILYVSGSGAVGIGTSNVGAFTLQVSGSFGATTKSFIIDHPTKAGKKLMYGSLESPYHGIRLTGRDTLKEGKCKIQLPDYIYKLILHDSVNIQLTGIKCNKTLYVDDINVPENYFTIAYDKAMFETYKDYDFFWDFTAIRADVPELITEL